MKNVKKLKSDALGSRMKDYEMRSRSYLPRRSNIMIRIDGKAFHTYTRGLEKPFDEGLMEDMSKTTEYLCSKIQGAKLGYTQSDEISILLTDYDTIKSDAWYDGQVQKIVSVASSMATAKFNQLRTLRFLKAIRLIQYVNLQTAMDEIPLAEFDARVYTLPDVDEVVNYFIWRQQDASKNSISMLAQANFSHNSLQKLNGSQMQDKLMLEKNINWSKLTVPKKRGYCIIRKNEIWVRPKDYKSFTPFVLDENIDPIHFKDEIFYERNSWVVDEDIPIFTQVRNYVSDVLPKR
jgi:tRNA(His) 5'-end guanylyltransferase